jgi:hypothetical protein
VSVAVVPVLVVVVVELTQLPHRMGHLIRALSPIAPAVSQSVGASRAHSAGSRSPLHTFVVVTVEVVLIVVEVVDVKVVVGHVLHNTGQFCRATMPTISVCKLQMS